jgi:hypothetical protein
MHLTVVPRMEVVALRCAYCHGDLGAGKRCPACSTLLHDDCWILAEFCPTLGCRPPLRILLREALRRAPGATVWNLGWWLAVFSAVWVSLIGVVPAFEKMFTETGLSLPGATEALVAVSRFARSPLGLWAATVLLVGSVAAFRQARSSPAVRRSYVALTLMGLAFFPFAVVALFLPQIQICQKL